MTDDSVVTDALDRSLAPDADPSAPGAPDAPRLPVGFAFRLPEAVPRREGTPEAATTPDEVLVAAAAAGWQVDPALVGGRARTKRPGSLFGRVFGPLLIVSLVGSMGFGAWKLVEAAGKQKTTASDGPGLEPTVLPPEETVFGAIPSLVTGMGDTGILTPYPGTASVLPTFRSATATMTVEMAAAGVVATATVTVRVDVVDQIGEVQTTTSDGSGPTTAILVPGYLFTPGEAFGAPWTRTPDDTNWLDDGAMLLGLDAVVAGLGSFAPMPLATLEVVDDRALTTYESDISVDGAIPTWAASMGTVGWRAQDTVHFRVTADVNGVVWAMDLASLEETVDVAGAGSTEPVLTHVHYELGGWSDEALGLALPPDWVDA